MATPGGAQNSARVAFVSLMKSRTREGTYGATSPSTRLNTSRSIALGLFAAAARLRPRGLLGMGWDGVGWGPPRIGQTGRRLRKRNRGGCSNSTTRCAEGRCLYECRVLCVSCQSVVKKMVEVYKRLDQLVAETCLEMEQGEDMQADVVEEVEEEDST
eukprot:2793058-Rhodomonas_salina.1